MKASILFLDMNHTTSRIAEALARKYCKEGITLQSAGLSPVPIAGQLHEYLGSSGSSPSIKTVLSTQYDIVVTIGNIAGTLMFPGVPATLTWAFDELTNGSDVDTNLQELSPIIESYVKNLFSHGVVNSLLRQRICLKNVLDSLNEGIIAHDLDRKIFLFSRGAEAITGLKKEHILGMNCHELFTPRICGDQCIFWDGTVDYEKIPRSEYSAIFDAGDGVRKELDVTRVPLRDEEGKVTGVIVTFTDATRIRLLEEKLGESESFKGIIGRDHKMISIFELIRDLATSDFPVVITGESGTGKELVAAAIHKESNRRDRLFVPVNCGALPEGTLESELFGHVRGAFTGAIRDKKGRFELADKGTLFLDEIGELSQPMQVKLLRVLQEGVFEPVGSEHSKQVDVRVICATNRNLRDMTARGQFREDLYYRLAVVPIEVPPLRERRNDIVTLANHFLEKISHKLSRGEMYFTDETVSILMNYNWPGNVRQLQNAIQFAMIKCRASTINPEHLPPEVLNESYVALAIPKIPGKAGRKPKLSLDVVQRALDKSGGNKAKAARLLGVGRATLYNFLNEHEDVAIAE